MKKHSNSFTRRQFIQTGTTLIPVTTVAGTTTLLNGCDNNPDATLPPPWHGLRPKDREILTAVAPAILKADLPLGAPETPAKITQLINHIEIFLRRSSQYAQQEMTYFFDQIYFPPLRIALTGLWRGWSHASIEDIDAFMERWRTSSINKLRIGYGQLAQLIQMVWYGLPDNWPALHYPGPPDHIPTPPLPKPRGAASATPD